MTYGLSLSGAFAALPSAEAPSAPLSGPVDKGSNGGSTTAQVSVTGLTDGDRLYAFIGTRRSTTTSKPTISDTEGLTWAEVADFAYDPGTNPRMRGTIYSAVSNGNDTTITAQGVSTPSCTGLQVVAYQNAGAPSSNVASGGDAAGDPSATISAPAATSGVIAFGWMADGVNPPVPSGWDELVDFLISSPNSNRLVTCYGDSADTAITWTTTNTHSVATVLEVPAA